MTFDSPNPEVANDDELPEWARTATVSDRDDELDAVADGLAGQLPAVTISFNLRAGVALGDAVGEIQKLQGTLGMPATVVTSFQGTAQAFKASMKGLGLLVLAAIVVIYLVLGILYESLVHPITVLSTLPSAGVGAFLALMVSGIPVAMAMAGAALIYVMVSGNIPDFVVIHRMYGGVDSFPLLAVPFFIWAGNLMNSAGITNRIYNFALALVGWLKGGLGHVNVVGSMIFAGMSGTAIATWFRRTAGCWPCASVEWTAVPTRIPATNNATPRIP